MTIRPLALAFSVALACALAARTARAIESPATTPAQATESPKAAPDGSSPPPNPPTETSAQESNVKSPAPGKARWHFVLEAGGELAMLSSSPEHGGTTTTVPVVGAGFGLPRDWAVLGELGLLDYSVTKSGSRQNLKLSEGSLAVQGTSIAAVGLKKFDRLAARFGYGIIQYHYTNKLGSAVTSTLAAGGFTNYFENVKDATGQQVLLGADFFVTPHFVVGAEFRSVTVQPKVEVGLTLGSTSASASGTADLSHTWIGLRALYWFSA